MREKAGQGEQCDHLFSHFKRKTADIPFKTYSKSGKTSPFRSVERDVLAAHALLAILRAVQSLKRCATKILYCFLESSRIFSYLLLYANVGNSHAHTFFSRAHLHHTWILNMLFIRNAMLYYVLEEIFSFIVNKINVNKCKWTNTNNK